MNIKITATNTEQFLKIENMLKKLPESILLEIASCEENVLLNSIECTFRNFNNCSTITLPDNVTKILNIDGTLKFMSNEFIFILNKNEFFNNNINFHMTEKLINE